MGKRHNTFIAVLLVIFTLISMYGFNTILTDVIQQFEALTLTTGRAASSGGEVIVNISAAPSLVNVTPSQTIGGGGKKAFLSLLIDTAAERDISELRLTLLPDQEQQLQLYLRNEGDITLSLVGETTFPDLRMYPKTFSVRPQQRGAVMLTVPPLQPGVHTGIIAFSNDLFVKYLPLIIIVEEPQTTLTAQLTIPEAFKTVQRSNDLFSKLTITGALHGYIDLTYIIKDQGNTAYHTLTDRVKAQKPLSVEKTFTLPPKIFPGSYILGVAVTYNGVTIHAADTFMIVHPYDPTVEQPAPTPKRTYLPLWILIIILILLVVLRHLLGRDDSQHPYA